MDDQIIIKRLLGRDESALDEITRQYSRLYLQILRQILADESDVAECANDVLLALWNSIPPNRPQCFSAYLCKLARRIGIDRLRHDTRQKRNSGYTVALSELEECLPAHSSWAEETDQHIRDLLSDFIRELDPETRILFVRRYICLEPVASLAQRFRLRENHVAVKLYRARNKLKKRLQKEGIHL